MVLKGKLCARCFSVIRRWYPRSGRKQLAAYYLVPTFRTTFEDRRAAGSKALLAAPLVTSVDGVQSSSANPEQNTVVEELISTQAEMAPRGKYVLFTPGSYERNHEGRNYIEDKRALQKVQTSKGMVDRIATHLGSVSLVLGCKRTHRSISKCEPTAVCSPGAIRVSLRLHLVFYVVYSRLSMRLAYGQVQVNRIPCRACRTYGHRDNNCM